MITLLILFLAGYVIAWWCGYRCGEVKAKKAHVKTLREWMAADAARAAGKSDPVAYYAQPDVSVIYRYPPQLTCPVCHQIDHVDHICPGPPPTSGTLGNVERTQQESPESRRG